MTTDPKDPCCYAIYYCPTSGDWECYNHGGFDHCCDDPQCPGYYERRKLKRASTVFERPADNVYHLPKGFL